MKPPRYGRLAGVYRWLEYAAFGRTLQKAREAGLDRLAGAKHILVLGAGDGRVLPPLLDTLPEAMIDSIDCEPEFIERARALIEPHPSAGRVQFLQADVRLWQPPSERYDAVVTQFFLDCFPEPDLGQIVTKVAGSLRLEGTWLFTDFAIPRDGPYARWRARMIVGALCGFFRWQANHPLRSLPPMDAALEKAGFVSRWDTCFSRGLIRASILMRRD